MPGHFYARETMASKPQAMIDYAVRTCLDLCVSTNMPMTCLTDYISQLQESGWDDSSMEEFQRAVLLALSKSAGQTDANQSQAG